jgi:hypothetical protein
LSIANNYYDNTLAAPSPAPPAASIISNAAIAVSFSPLVRVKQRGGDVRLIAA